MTDSEDTTTDNQPGRLIFEIFTALEGLGGEYNLDHTRVEAAGVLLGQVNSEWDTNRGAALANLQTLLMQLNALFRDHNSNGPLADAISAAETLLGTWSGDDYV